MTKRYEGQGPACQGMENVPALNLTRDAGRFRECNIQNPSFRHSCSCPSNLFELGARRFLLGFFHPIRQPLFSLRSTGVRQFRYMLPIPSSFALQGREY